MSDNERGIEESGYLLSPKEKLPRCHLKDLSNSKQPLQIGFSTLFDAKHRS